MRIYHAFIDQTLAFAALDAASLALPERRAARGRGRCGARPTPALPAATHPSIAEAAPLLVTRMVTSAYPTALDMLLDSAQARLAALTAAGRRP